MRRLKVKRTRFDIAIEIICLSLLIGIITYLLVKWNSLPDQVPGHYNGKGEVDRWGSKGELFILPVVSWLLYLGITFVEAFPVIWNTGIKVTEENKEKVYRLIKSMIGLTKLIMIINFTFIEVNSIQGTSLPWFYLPVFLILMFGVIILYIVRLVRIK